MANPRKVLAVPQSVTNQRLPTEAELLKLTVMTSYVFDLPIAAGLKKRLKEDAEVYWEWLQYQQYLKAETQHASLGTDEQGHKCVAYGTGDKDSVSDPEMVTCSLRSSSHVRQSSLGKQASSGFSKRWKRSWSHDDLIRKATGFSRQP